MVNQKWEEPLDKAKPFDISKHVVWEAYLRVKANKGAAGIDEQSITDFERELKNNLYKIWNRMSSGSYFPPPVRRVRNVSITLRHFGEKFRLQDEARRPLPTAAVGG